MVLCWWWREALWKPEDRVRALGWHRGRVSKQGSVAAMYEMGLVFTCLCSVVLLWTGDAGGRERQGRYRISWKGLERVREVKKLKGTRTG